MTTMPKEFWDLAKDSRRAYRVVDAFEAELCDYTGAPFAVAVNSCTNALLLALTWERKKEPLGIPRRPISLPKRTYIGVLQSVLNAGWNVEWRSDDWARNWQFDGWYRLGPAPVFDFARNLVRGMYTEEMMRACSASTCLSFHAAKQLPIGRGGAILTDNEEAAEWFRAARMDGRAPGDVRDPVFPAFHCPMPPDVAARGLDVLSRWNDRGYSPPPLPHEDYPDLSQWWPR